MNNSGDTIIEVLISMTILALVLAGTFVVTNHSLSQGTAANNRQTATSYGQQQIELIKVNPASYEAAGRNFCAQTGSTVPQTDLSKCVFGGQFTINDSYKSGLFTVAANWPGPAGSDQLTFYYKAAP